MILDDNLNDIHRTSDLISSSAISNDMVTSICGKYIGSGAYRIVFDYNLDPKWVVKIEVGSISCNMIEYQMWQEIKGLRGNLAFVKQWTAPVGWISPNGRIMTMRKTLEKPNKKRPKKIPKIFWDAHYKNFGWIGKQLVCHDYGFLHQWTNYKKGMVKKEW